MIKLIKNGTVITMDEDRDKKYEKLDINKFICAGEYIPGVLI